AGWLAAAVPAEPDRLEELEMAGRRLGRRLASDGRDVPVEQRIQAVLAALGFQPHLHRDTPSAMRFELRNCPYRDAVRANQPAVCTLHRGITRGLLDTLDGRPQLRSFVPRDPDRAGCIVEIEQPDLSAAVTPSVDQSRSTTP
ncbi:MAG: hypothetical protein QOH46_3416, partial [Solirubrobacteraceae bacterium]|nr:hypothetical protein [Solirubrobacteraceae bacterium]